MAEESCTLPSGGQFLAYYQGQDVQTFASRFNILKFAS